MFFTFLSDEKVFYNLHKTLFQPENKSPWTLNGFAFSPTLEKFFFPKNFPDCDIPVSL